MQSQPAAINRSQKRPKLCLTAVPTLRPLASRFLVMLSVWRERRALRTASDEMLNDIGVDRPAAILESRRTFYDLPADRFK